MVPSSSLQDKVDVFFYKLIMTSLKWAFSSIQLLLGPSQLIPFLYQLFELIAPSSNIQPLSLSHLSLLS